MDYVKNPKEIEDKSMQIIYDYVKDLGLTDDEVRVVSRTVHASGDVEYAQLVKMSPNAVQKGIEALESGANIYTDVEMVRTGISKPALIIGIPVGFVGAAESKDYLMEVSPVPYITVKGNKGGSPIAASVCNALLYTDVKRNDMLFVEGKESK